MAALAGCTGGNSSGSGSDNASGGTTAGSANGSERNATTGAETAAPTGTNASTTSTNASGNATGGGSGGTKTVGMYTDGGSYYFDPIGLFVETGTTITFKDESGAHSSTAYKKGTASAEATRIPKGAEAWNSDTISEGKTYEHTFETEGTYDYFCIPHKTLGMVGRIVVGSPGGPAEGSMPPDGKVPKSGKIVEQGSIANSDFS